MREDVALEMILEMTPKVREEVVSSTLGKAP